MALPGDATAWVLRNALTRFVTRHDGAKAWARARGFTGEFEVHFDAETVRPGDIVAGTLPVDIAARVCARGGRYFHLVFEQRPNERGTERSADDMAAAGARLEGYRIVAGEGK
jgi:CRISPR-associated protein Csx16